MATCCPKTFTGFCLDDNTPIAITIDNGVIVSWTNLVTGTVTPGNPPAGTGICEVPSTVIVEIEPLTCDKDSVTVCQQAADTFDVEIIGLVDTRPLDCLTDSVTICTGDPLEVFGTVTALQGTSPWVVSGTVTVVEPVTVDGVVELGAATLAALETITVLQGTSPWVVSGTVSVTEPVTVDAVDLDIRNLVFATDKADVSGSTVTVSNFPASAEVVATEKSLVPKGYQQITPVVSTALTVPGGAIFALLQARVADVSYRDDGVAPTTLIGMRIVLDNSLFYTGDLAAVRVISAGGTVDILYYGVV